MQKISTETIIFSIEEFQHVFFQLCIKDEAVAKRIFGVIKALTEVLFINVRNNQNNI